MKKKINIYQYLSLVRYRGLLKLINNINDKTPIILDLEDSSKDIFNNKNTIKLKKNCRQGIIFLSKKLSTKKNSIYVRINSIKSKYFDEDIKCLKQVIKKKFINGIFIPKVTDYKIIEKISKLINVKNNNIKLIPMIESDKGIKNLESIMEDDVKNNFIFAIHYGHFDYCLSKKTWPFPEPYHIEYWNICELIIKLCIKYKKQFIQTPFPFINKPELFYGCIKYMKSRFSNLKFGMTVVNYNQSYINIKEPKKNLKLKKQGNNTRFKFLLAKKVCKNYIKNKNSKKSFSLTDKWFIPPHQYLAAKLFLHKNEKN